VLELSAGVPNGKCLGTACVLRRRTNANKRPPLDSHNDFFSRARDGFKNLFKPITRFTKLNCFQRFPG